MAFFFKLDFLTTRTFKDFGDAFRAEAAGLVFFKGLDLRSAIVLAFGSGLTALVDLYLSASTADYSLRFFSSIGSLIVPETRALRF